MWPKRLAVPIRVRIALFGMGVVTLTVALFSFVFYALLASVIDNPKGPFADDLPHDALDALVRARAERP